MRSMSFILICFAFNASANAYYYSVAEQMPSYSNQVNNSINIILSNFIQKINQRNKSYSCEELAQKLMMKLANSSEKIDEVFSHKYVINLNEVYVNKDYFKSFFLEGHRINRNYQKYRGDGYSRIGSIEHALEKSIRNQILNFQYNDKVFSFAQLEMIFQGLQFSLDLCGHEPVLSFEANKWKVIKDININAYITAQMDEAYNHVSAKSRKAKKIASQNKKLCQYYDSASIQDRFKSYRDRFSQGFVMEYLKQEYAYADFMRQADNLSFKSICDEN